MQAKSYYSPCSPAVEKLLLEIEGQAVKTQPKITIPPRNYSKENIRRLKHIQECCKRKEMILKTPVKALPITKTPPIENGIKLPDNRLMATTSQIPKLCPQMLKIEGVKQTPFVKDYKQRRSFPVQKSEASDSLEVNCSKPERRCKTLTRTESLREKRPNSCERRLSLPRTESLKEIPQLKEKKSIFPHLLGSIPKYLIARRQKWKEEADLKKKESERDATIPPGHTLMSNEERLETLNLLEKTRDELLKKLNSLPFQICTMRAKNEKADIEEKLKKAENGIEIFSRSRVLIKHDDNEM